RRTRMRPRLLLVSSLVAVACGAAACGQAQKDLVARALQSPIHDADIHFTLSMTNQGGRLLDVAFAGPYHFNGPHQLESFDFNARFAAHMAGTTRDFAARVVSTGRDVFVVYKGVTYQVGAQRIARFERRARANASDQPRLRTLADLERNGIHLDSWFPDATI